MVEPAGSHVGRLTNAMHREAVHNFNTTPPSSASSAAILAQTIAQN
jgi:hypothetical protein